MPNIKRDDIGPLLFKRVWNSQTWREESLQSEALISWFSEKEAWAFMAVLWHPLAIAHQSISMSSWCLEPFGGQNGPLSVRIAEIEKDTIGSLLVQECEILKVDVRSPRIQKPWLVDLPRGKTSFCGCFVASMPLGISLSAFLLAAVSSHLEAKKTTHLPCNEGSQPRDRCRWLASSSKKCEILDVDVGSPRNV
jgi:hypothetical protein